VTNDDALWDPRWRGQPGRLEVWYGTFTDEASGDGLWLHHELVAPIDGGPPHTTAWAARFPAGGEPTWSRCEAIDLTPGGSKGDAGDLRWDLSWGSGSQRALYTFPRWAWQREILPAAQIVPAPSLAVDGSVGEEPFSGHGAVARIYGHGNAKAWGWLHADLGGGDVLEAVSAVSMRPGLRALPPITHLRLRLAGRDVPSLQGPSFRLRTRLDLPTWTITGHVGRDRVEMEVHQPLERCVAIDYADPDGAGATCTNTERADVTIRYGDRHWELAGTGHAEVGSRP
jgi:hypothetical protein